MATSQWLHGPLTDTLLGWSFLPVVLVVHVLGSNVTAVQALVAGVYLLSFAHQPLTLGLVYGDPVQRAAHRKLYRWAPVVVAVAIVAGLALSFTLVAAVAVLWNAEHTLMQRYGLMRIYGRKVGDRHGPLEKLMLIVWLLVAVAFLAAYVDLEDMVRRLGLDETNAQGVQLLDPWQNPARVLFWTTAAVGVALAARWWRAERALGAAASRAKHIYTLGTAVLVVAVMLDPIAGVAGYVAAHAIEYYSVVHRSLRTRRDDAPVARATRDRRRRVGVYTVYFAGTAVFVWATIGMLDGRVYAFAILFFGALHILYDGLVWKLRRPHVAAALGV